MKKNRVIGAEKVFKLWIYGKKRQLFKGWHDILFDRNSKV